MPQFNYKALDKGGKEIRGSIDATGEEAVVERLRSMGYFATEVIQVKTGMGQMDLSDLPIFRFIGKVISRGKVGLKDLSTFTRQLATLVGAGLPLLRGLQILQEQVENKNLQEALVAITHDVESGSNLSDAMSKHPRIFNKLFVNMVKAGEIGGALEEVLDRLAVFNEKSAALRGKVKSAMIYPVVVVSIALIVVAIIMIKVVPKFKEMFEGMGAELPYLTTLLINASEWVQKNWWAPPVILVATIIGFKLFASTRAGGFILDRVKLRLPVFGTIIQKSCIARFARTFGTLLDTGVPILQTLTIVRETSGNEVVARGVEEIHASIRDGDTVSEPMKNYPVFPIMVVHMVAVGEETGALDKMLIKVADSFEREVDDAVEGMAKLIEPFMIVLLGGLIGGVVVALYLPIFTVGNAIGK